MKLSIKPGELGALVDADHFRQEIADIVRTVILCAPSMEADTVVITSGKDSHATGKHPVGDALDFRGRSIVASSLFDRRAEGKLWAARVQARLGMDYDVLWEQPSVTQDEAPGARDHLHVEYDPKPPDAPPSPGFFARIKLLQARQGGLA